jgi:hypothetical protein
MELEVRLHVIFQMSHITHISVGELDTKLENIWGVNLFPTDN